MQAKLTYSLQYYYLHINPLHSVLYMHTAHVHYTKERIILQQGAHNMTPKSA